MKKIILLIFIGLSVSVSAQITFEKDTVKESGDKSEFVFEAKSHLTNNHTDTKYRFTRITFPNCNIETAVCDNQLCYPPDTSSQNMVIDADSSFDMKVNFYPNNQEGECLVLLYVRSLTNPENYDSCFYYMRTNGFSAINDVKANKVKLYPNPSTSSIHLETDNKSTYAVKIYNAVGTEVLSIDSALNGETIDITSLIKGVYFVRVIGEVSSTTTLHKL